MTIAISSLALVAGIALGAPVTSTVEATPRASAVAATCCDAEMAQANALRLAGDVKAAHSQYIRIARRQAAAGEFAGDALWQAAEISFTLGKKARAARELDGVAQSAAEFGRPNLQVRALLEAAILYQQDGLGDRAVNRLARVDVLLASPDVSSETRQRVEGRVVRS